MFGKKRVINVIAILFFISLFGVLIFYSNSSFTDIAQIILGGVVIGVFWGFAISSFLGFINPNEWIYKHRYTLEGIGWGLMIGSINIFTDILNQQVIGLADILIPIIVGCILGVIWIKVMKFKKFKTLKSAVIEQEDTKDTICSDIGRISILNNEDVSGLLLLTKDRLQFFSKDSYEKTFDTALSDINPEIIKSGFLKIPSGIQLAENNIIKPVKFPLYWLDKIRDQKQLQG